MLSFEEKARYSRQLMMPEFGEAGQEKLKKARVLIAGLGGLGSVSAYYLAAAGIGYLKIIDMDRVAVENLNRQIIHLSGDIGRAKTDSAYEKLSSLNPFCQIDPVQAEITRENVTELVQGCGLIIDGTDNIATRKILNLVSIEKSIPYIYGGIDGFNGMVTTFLPGITPCFECLFSGKEDKKSRVGVIGPIPAMVASIQCLEAVKVILERGKLLARRLMYIRGLEMQVKEIKIEKNPDCRICSDVAVNDRHYRV